MSAITRNMREATFQITTGRPVTHTESILRQCVSAGLLSLDRGVYGPTADGVQVSNGEAIDVGYHVGRINGAHTMSAITRNMREATFQITTGRPVTHTESILRQCVSAGLLSLDRGEYGPTADGVQVSNGEAIDRVNAEVLRRRNARTIGRAILGQAMAHNSQA